MDVVYKMQLTDEAKRAVLKKKSEGGRLTIFLHIKDVPAFFTCLDLGF